MNVGNERNEKPGKYSKRIKEKVFLHREACQFYLPQLEVTNISLYNFEILKFSIIRNFLNS